MYFGISLLLGHPVDGPRSPYYRALMRASTPAAYEAVQRFFRSSRHTRSMASSETFPGGFGYDTEEGRLFKGGVRTPRAINRRSCSE